MWFPPRSRGGPSAPTALRSSSIWPRPNILRNSLRDESKHRLANRGCRSSSNPSSLVKRLGSSVFRYVCRRSHTRTEGKPGDSLSPRRRWPKGRRRSAAQAADVNPRLVTTQSAYVDGLRHETPFRESALSLKYLQEVSPSIPGLTQQRAIGS